MNVLFLQGHPSPFSFELGQALGQRGHIVHRVNVCIGDWLFWRGKDCTHWSGRFADWEGWIERQMKDRGVTHLVYFADRQPYHVAAQRAARRLGVICVSYEFGYLRPDWITLEEGGQSVFSHFPASLPEVKRRAAGLPSPDMTRRYERPFLQEAVSEVAYHLGNALLHPVQRHFVADRSLNPFVEYLCYIPRNIRGMVGAKRADREVRTLLQSGDRFHVLALQMAGDYQIRDNSPVTDYPAAVAAVIRSHARHAAAGSRLVVKIHPMDNGFVRWRRIVAEAARVAGHQGRVLFLDGGDLMALLGRAEGCVVVNSTVGLHALQAGCPVKTLGVATYDMAGLTHQGTLESFWTNPERPDADGVAAIVNLMAASIQVRGDFFSKPGRANAVREAVALLESGLARRFGAFVTPPPRLARAREAGMRTDPWE